MHQLFTNLLTNALKFAREGVPPKIKITVKKENNPVRPGLKNFKPGDYFVISIADNGIGFDSQYNEKIFGLFQRLHARSDYSGTGIGLSICKKIVENHNGYIEAYGEIGKGATFTFYIPAKND